MNLVVLVAFLFLKTGEKFATQETAGQTVGEFTACVAKAIGGVGFEPCVLNDPVKAVEFCTTKKPAVGIVTPGFYLAYQKALDMEPLLEVRRQKVEKERYVVVVKKGAGDGLDAVRGKVLATTSAAEERYITGVILQDKVAELRLKPVTDIEGAVFDLVEGAKDAAGAVLLEEAAWRAMEKDEELGPKLKVAHRSEELPGTLVVAFRPNVGKLDLCKLKAALTSMNKSEEGRATLGSIRVEAFDKLNEPRLKKAQESFLGKLQ
jgi:ABC-type phosphate/phosphonate transport system substrate-binding protein